MEGPSRPHPPRTSPARFMVLHDGGGSSGVRDADAGAASRPPRRASRGRRPESFACLTSEDRGPFSILPEPRSRAPGVAHPTSSPTCRACGRAPLGGRSDREGLRGSPACARGRRCPAPTRFCADLETRDGRDSERLGPRPPGVHESARSRRDRSGERAVGGAGLRPANESDSRPAPRWPGARRCRNSRTGPGPRRRGSRVRVVTDGRGTKVFDIAGAGARQSSSSRPRPRCSGAPGTPAAETPVPWW
jgi:hypothetical protein